MNYWENLSLENISEIFEGELCVERWKKIPGYDGIYWVSTFGRVKSFGTHATRKRGERILKQNFGGASKYLFVTLYKDKKGNQISTHVLVARAFIRNPKQLPEVNHKKGVKTDNRHHQLEWSTRSHNLKHAHAMGLKKANLGMLGKFGQKHHNSKKVQQINNAGVVVAEFWGTREAERATGIKQISISRAARSDVRMAGGFKWKYV